jgi:MFS family permease
VAGQTWEAGWANLGPMTTTLTIDSDPATQPQHPRRWRALTVSLAAAFMTLLDVSIVKVALPSIERDLGATVGLATAAGPVIGGLILAAFTGPDGWRWVFYVNLPIGLVALVLAARLVPAATRAGWRGVHLDVVGALLLGGGVLCLLLPLVDATIGGLARLWPLSVLAAGLLAGFVWWEARTARQGHQPLLDPQLARTSG